MTTRAVTRPQRGRTVTVAWALAVACVASALRVGPAHGASAPQWAPLASRVAAHATRLRLDEPNVPGGLGWDSELTPVTQQVIDEDRAFRADALRDLNAIASSGVALSPRARADAALLRGRLDQWAIERDELRRFETDPGYVCPRVDDTLRELLADRPGALCRRLPLATRRLRAVPELLRAAKVGLRNPSTLSIIFATTRLQQTLALYRHDMPAALYDCRESSAMAHFATADTLAVRAIEQHIEWLRGLGRERATGEWVMGRESFARWLAAASGDATPLDSLRARAQRELDAMGPANDPSWRVTLEDSTRSMEAGRLLESRARRNGPGSAHWLRTVLGTREPALAWARRSDMLFSGEHSTPAEVALFAPSRLDLVGALAELDLHAGTASFVEVVNRFRRDAGLDQPEAERATEASAIAPFRARATISTWELEALRADALRRSPRFSDAAFLSAVIEAGAVPVPAIREEVLLRLHARNTPSAGQ